VTTRSGIAGNASWALLRRPLAGGAWTRLVTQASAIGNIATQARVAAILDGTSVLVTGHPYYGDMLGQLLLTGNGGRTWHAVRF
jgi:hypothetical protein